MSIQEIEQAIKQLPATEVAELSRWLADYHYELWDQQIEADLESGRLDDLLNKVDAEIEQGLARPL